MDKTVKRITVIRRSGDTAEGTVIYRRAQKPRQVSTWLRPLERVVRRHLKANVILAEESLRRHDASNRRRKNGWLLDLPANAVKARIKAHNEEGRKAVPLRLLPKL
jgi:hypothetical protein